MDPAVNGKEESQFSKCLHFTPGHGPHRRIISYFIKQELTKRTNSPAHTCRHKEKTLGLNDRSLHSTRKWNSRLEKGQQLLPQATQAKIKRALRPGEKGFLNLSKGQTGNLRLLLTHQNSCHHGHYPNQLYFPAVINP